MNRIAFCFDGTWDRLGDKWPYSTNVVLTAQSISPVAPDGTVQIVHYDQGVGTAFGTRYLGGALGFGVLNAIETAYTFLVFNYRPGDEIFVFGFSRGAFTARAFVGLLRTVGILRSCDANKIRSLVRKYRERRANDDSDSNELLRFRFENTPQVCVDSKEDAWRCQQEHGYVSGSSPLLKIRYLGLWDTVESIGIPQALLWEPIYNLANRLFNIDNYFDVDLSDMVESGRHAVSIDENRDVFAPTLWAHYSELNAARGVDTTSKDAPYQQKWFPGGHGSVGGGGPQQGLSDAALDWVVTGARKAGLAIDLDANSQIFKLKPDSLAPLDNMASWKLGVIDALNNALLKIFHRPRTGPSALHEVDATAITRWRLPADSLPENSIYRPKTLQQVSNELENIRKARALYQPVYDPAAIPTPLTAVPTPGRYYRVVLNDSLRGIAEKAYGDASKSTDILNRNWILLNDDADRIYPDQQLYIPRLDELTADTSEVPRSHA